MPELKVQRFEDRLTAQSVLFEANVFGRAHNFHSKCFSGLQNCNELRLAGKWYVTARAYARGGFGLEPPLQLDILRKVHYLRKGD